MGGRKAQQLVIIASVDICVKPAHGHFLTRLKPCQHPFHITTAVVIKLLLHETRKTSSLYILAILQHVIVSTNQKVALYPNILDQNQTHIVGNSQTILDQNRKHTLRGNSQTILDQNRTHTVGISQTILDQNRKHTVSKTRVDQNRKHSQHSQSAVIFISLIASIVKQDFIGQTQTEAFVLPSSLKHLQINSSYRKHDCNMADLLSKFKKDEADTQTRKVRMTSGPSSSDATSETLQLIAKLTLSNTSQLRVINAAVLTTFRLSANAAAVTAAGESVQQYIQVQKQLKEDGIDKEQAEEQLGPFHVHVFNGVLKAMLSDTNVSPEKKKQLQDYCSQVGHWKQMGYELRAFKISKMRESRYRRVELRIEDSPQILEGQTRLTSIAPVIMGWLMAQPGAKQLMGTAPSGDLARRLQKIVDENEGDI